MPETCKQTLEITVPLAEVESETDRVVSKLRGRVKIPGFRPGKVPPDLIRKRYEADIRQEVLESLVPKHFRKRVEQDNLRVVGSPDVSEVHFEKGEPLRFKAEFEVAPDIELQDYRDLTVAYSEPQVTDDDVAQRLEELRDQKADWVNLDPRPVEDGDYAAVSLLSLAGVEGKPIQQDELVIRVGDEQTLAAFSENLRGAVPGDVKELDVTYPEGYGDAHLAGKTVRFRMTLKAIRRKDLPELNDEFAHDLGDYQNLEELRDAVRKSIFREREFLAQQEAKEKLVDQLVVMHDFPVPEAFVDRQIEMYVEQRLRLAVAQGVDPRSIKVNWSQFKASQHDKAVRDVKASLLLDRIADREAIATTNDELDREVQRIARQEREPVAAVRMRLEKDDALRRIATRIRSEKTLNFLFEHSRKVAAEA